MSRKLLAMIIAMISVLALLVAIPFASTVAADEPVTALAGDGSEVNPYLIGTKEELAFFAANATTETYIESYVKLTADIIWSEFDGDPDETPDAPNWTPIGTADLYFKGTFDGDGHTIYGIYTDVTDSTGTGLFTAIEGTIQNLAIDNSVFKANKWASAFTARYVGETTIRNCANYATIICDGDSFAGAFAAREMDGKMLTISRCVNFGDVLFKTSYSKASNAYVGGIVGMTNNVTATYCANFGDVILSGANAMNAGGIFGLVDGGSIKNSYNAGHIYSFSRSAGIIGNLRGNVSTTLVENCINYGVVEVNATNNRAAGVGAIFGNYKWEDTTAFGNKGGTNYGTVENCYALKGTVISAKESYCDTLNRSEIKNDLTYVDADFFAAEDAVEQMGFDPMVWVYNCGVEGAGFGYPTLAERVVSIVTLPYEIPEEYTYVFLTHDYKILSTGILTEGSVIVAPEVPVIPTTINWVYTFTGWEGGYYDGMKISENVVFRATYSQEVNNNNPFLVEGDGTAENPYKVASAGNLEYVIVAMGGGGSVFTSDGLEVIVNPAVNGYDSCIVLTADIDWAAYKGVSDNNWAPIGPKKTPFTGVFDGQGHTVSGIYVYDESTSGNGEGFFGHAGGGALIKNLIIKDSKFVSYNHVGAFVGMHNKGSLTIENCVNYAEIVCMNATAGGIVGGGASGSTDGTNIRNCVNYGNITLDSTETAAYTGGIIGRAGAYGPANIENCANFGDITSTSVLNCLVGGVVGQAGKGDGMDGVIIQNCYNAGDVTGMRRLAGGITGRAYSPTVVKNCYNIGAVVVLGEDTAENALEQASLVGGVNAAYTHGTINNSYHLKDCAKSTSALYGAVHNGGEAIPEGIHMIPYKYQGIALEDASMKGASAVANMKLDESIWQATNGYPILKTITIAPQYNGEYTPVESQPPVTTTPTTTEAPPVTTTEPPVTSEIPVTTTETPVTSTETPVTSTETPVTTTGTPTTTEPGSADGNNAWIWIVVAVVAVAVIGGVVFFVVKKK